MPAGLAPAGILDTQIVKSKQFNLNLNQAAGTYDAFTAGGGNILIVDVTFYNDVAATGLVSVVAQTNDSEVRALFASVLLAALTGGKNLVSAVLAPFTLASGKKGQYTIAGTGTGGSIKALVRYMSAVAGADLS